MNTEIQSPRIVRAWTIPAFTVGDRVIVTRGGYRGETGSVRHIHAPIGNTTGVTITLDSGTLYYGSSRNLKVIA